MSESENTVLFTKDAFLGMAAVGMWGDIPSIRNAVEHMPDDADVRAWFDPTGKVILRIEWSTGVALEPLWV